MFLLSEKLVHEDIRLNMKHPRAPELDDRKMI